VETLPYNYAVFLGSGGMTAGVYALNPDTGTVSAILTLPRGHSVYSMSLDELATKLALGTRTSQVSVVRLEDQANPAVVPTHRLPCGAAVLDLGWLPDSGLATLDHTWRVLLWEPSLKPCSVRSLATTGLPIGALCTADTELVVISFQGKILFNELPDGTIRRIIDGPPIARQLPPFKIVLWPHRNALVYPSATGQMATYANGALRVRDAHLGGFHVALPLIDGSLVTIGRHDGRLKRWDDVEGDCCHEVAAPRDIIAGAVASDREQSIVLVNGQGRAWVYELGADELKLKYHVEGSAYRSVTGPSVTMRLAIDRQRREERAHQIGEAIAQVIESGPPGQTDELHRELIDLGYERVSCELRAQEAQKHGDDVAELEARHRQSQLLSPTRPGARKYLSKYTYCLLVDFSQF